MPIQRETPVVFETAGVLRPLKNVGERLLGTSKTTWNLIFEAPCAHTAPRQTFGEIPNAYLWKKNFMHQQNTGTIRITM